PAGQERDGAQQCDECNGLPHGRLLSLAQRIGTPEPDGWPPVQGVRDGATLEQSAACANRSVAIRLSIIHQSFAVPIRVPRSLRSAGRLVYPDVPRAIPQPPPSMDTPTPDQQLALYRLMVRIRRCEEALAKAHQRGLIPGACHTYVGQEAVAV